MTRDEAWDRIIELAIELTKESSRAKEHEMDDLAIEYEISVCYCDDGYLVEDEMFYFKADRK